MQNKIWMLLLLLGLSMGTFSSCDKDDDDDDPVATCSDGILNQDETAIDCGGVCSACAETMVVSASIDGTAWKSETNPTVTSSGGSITIVADHESNGSRLEITVDGTTTGTYSEDQVSMEYKPQASGGSELYVAGSNNTKQVIITEASDGKLSGTFSGGLTLISTNPVIISIEGGEFNELSY